MRPHPCDGPLKGQPEEGESLALVCADRHDPWADVDKRYHVGDVCTGKGNRAWCPSARLSSWTMASGIIPNAELAHRRVNKPEEVASLWATR